MTYWFRGDYRNPAAPDWKTDAGVGHSFDIYDNGTLSTVGWDDTGGDRDYNDLVLEVAIVYRWAYFDALEPVATAREADVEGFARDELTETSTRRQASGLPDQRDLNTTRGRA